MNTIEVLTLLLVVFAALSYIDNHKKKHLILFMLILPALVAVKYQANRHR